MVVVVIMISGGTQQIPAVKAVPSIVSLRILRNPNLQNRMASMDLVVDRNSKAQSLKSTV